MAYHNLLSKTDRALVAYLVGLAAGGYDNIVPAKHSAPKGLNTVVIWSHDAVEDPPYSGTFTIQTSVQVKALAIDPEDDESGDAARIAADAFTSSVFDAFHDNLDSAGDKLADAITAAARAAATNREQDADLLAFTAFNISAKSIESGIEEGTNAWVDTLNLEIEAVPSNAS